MLQLESETRLPGHFTVVPDQEGIDSLLVTVKATITVDGPRVSLVDEQPPVLLEEVWRGEPDAGSIARPSDFSLLKPAAEYLVIGHAYPPPGRDEVDATDIGIHVAGREKLVHVVGDRVWRDGPLGAQRTSPARFRRLSLGWHRAWGGVRRSPDGEVVDRDPRNPAGVGFAESRGERPIDGRSIANLELPGRPIRSPRRSYEPVGTGPIAAHWEPRSRFGGTYDEDWEQHRAPYLPRDLDERFFLVAPPDQALGGTIRGGEEVRWMHLTPSGREHFAVPRLDVSCHVRLAGHDHGVPLSCDTLICEPDARRVTLLWRGRLRCDKQALRLERIRLTCPQAPRNQEVEA